VKNDTSNRHRFDDFDVEFDVDLMILTSYRRRFHSHWKGIIISWWASTLRESTFSELPSTKGEMKLHVHTPPFAMSLRKNYFFQKNTSRMRV
jgi:hypothetical protein